MREVGAWNGRKVFSNVRETDIDGGGEYEKGVESRRSQEKAGKDTGTL